MHAGHRPEMDGSSVRWPADTKIRVPALIAFALWGTNERKTDINGRTWYVALTKRF